MHGGISRSEFLQSLKGEVTDNGQAGKEKSMPNQKEVKGKFRFDQDSKRFHRFQVETDAGIVGTIYIPKTADGMPARITLEYAGQEIEQ